MLVTRCLTRTRPRAIRPKVIPPFLALYVDWCKGKCAQPIPNQVSHGNAWQNLLPLQLLAVVAIRSTSNSFNSTRLTRTNAPSRMQRVHAPGNSPCSYSKFRMISHISHCNWQRFCTLHLVLDGSLSADAKVSLGLASPKLMATAWLNNFNLAVGKTHMCRGTSA